MARKVVYRYFNKMILLIILFSILLTLIWYSDGLLMGAGESGLPFYNLEWQWEASHMAWNPARLGNVNGINVSTAPTYRVFGLVSEFLPTYMSQAIFIFLVLSFSGISLYFLSKELYPKISSKYYLISVLFYWFNPLITVNVWRRFLYNFMAFYAILPLLVLLLIKGVKEKDYRYAILIGVLSGVFAYGISSVVFVMLYSWIFVVTLLFYWYAKKIKIKFIIIFGATTFLFFLFSNFWWVSQLFSFVFSHSFTTSVTQYFTSSGNLASLVSLSQRLGNLSDIFLLKHNTFFQSELTHWISLSNNMLINFIGYLIIFIILLFSYKKRKDTVTLYLTILFVSSIFLIKGVNEPFGFLYREVFQNVTLLQVFRNPFEKFSFILAMITSLLIGPALRDSLKTYRETISSKILILAVIIILTLWSYPFVFDKIFSSTEGHRGSQVVSYDVQPPASYREVDNWLNKNVKNERVVVLPIGGEGITYDWDHPYSGLELSSILFSVPNISMNTTIPYYHEVVKYLNTNQLNDDIFNIFPYINAKYVIIRTDIDYRARRMPDPGGLLERMVEWENQGLVTKRFRNGELTVFKINNIENTSKIYSANRVDQINSKDFSHLENGYNNDLFINFELNQVDLVPEVIMNYPSEVLVIENFENIKNYTDTELLGGLFHAEHLPSTWLYPLVRLKETLETSSQVNPDGRMIHKIGLLGKRSVEVFNLIRQNSDVGIIVSAEREYIKTLQSLEGDINLYFKNDGSVGELVKYSLNYQHELLKRADSNITQDLRAFLVNVNLLPLYDLPISNDKYMLFRFDVFKSGEYKISFDGEKDNYYLDGNSVIQQLNNAEIYLDRGQHEISFVFDENENLSEIISKENLLLDDRSSYSAELNIPDISSEYVLEFDYIFRQGNEFILNFKQNIDADENPNYSNIIRKDGFDHGWKHFSTSINTTPGAERAQIYFEPVIEENCDRVFLVNKVCHTAEKDFTVEIRNLKVKLIQLPEMFLVMDNSKAKEVNSINSVKSIIKDNSTLYKASINKKNYDKEILVFSELFNSGWEAFYEDGARLEGNFLVNGYANGWVLDRPGEYEVTIKFMPQDLLDIGKKVSFYSILGGLLLFGGLTWRKRRY